MNTKPFYIGITVLIIALLIGLVGWAIYIGKQKQDLQTQTEDVTYLNDLTQGSSGGGLFGGIFSNDDSTETDFNAVDEEKAVFQQIYNLPIAGYIKMHANSVRFVDRATGHVFENDLEKSISTRINQATVPQVYNSIFLKDGNAVVRQSIDTDGGELTIFSLTEEGSTNTILPFLSSIVSSGDKFAFIEKTLIGSNLGIFDIEDGTKTTLTKSVLKNWLLQWEGSLILMTQKPSFNLLTSAYTVNSSTGEKKIILSQKQGLTTKLSPDGKKILFSSIVKGKPLLSIKTISTEETVDLSVSGFADKCAWHQTEEMILCALPDSLPQKEYPDAWYMGEVSFSDSFWKIDTKNFLITKVASPRSEIGLNMDVEDITIDGEVVFFKNKTDQTLWSLNL